ARDVVLVKPKERVPGQKTLYLTPPVIENECVPIWLLPLSWIGVFVKMSAIEVAQASLIFRKVRRNPIENNPNSVLMEIVHQEHEIRGRSKTTSRRKVADRLVAPRAIKRVLGNGEEFNMCEARVVYVVGQLSSHLPVGEPAVCLFGYSLPGTEVRLVYGNRRVQRVVLRPIRHPL